MENKRENSVLIPCKINDGNLFVYLQKRSKNATRLPDYFGLWGGGIEEGENPEQALVREVKEELEIDLDIKQVKFLSRYENLRAIKYAYLLEVSDGWEETVVVKEGDYGKWFPVDEVFGLNNLTFADKNVLNDLERMLLNKPIR